MASQNQPLRSCVLKVDVKCCSGCQASVKRKLQGIPGVTAIEYNAEEGLMIVSGDVNPTTLVYKFGKWGRKAEVVSVVQNQPMVQNSPDNNSAVSSNLNLNHGVEGGQSPVLDNPEGVGEDKSKKKKTKKQRKYCWLLRWIGKKISKSKVEPLRWPATAGENRNWQTPTRFENGRAWPFPNSPQPPPPLLPRQVIYPQHQAMYGCGPPPYPPYFGTAPPPPASYGAGMFRMVPPPPPPPSPPYFTSRQPLSPHMVNPMVHYNSY